MACCRRRLKRLLRWSHDGARFSPSRYELWAAYRLRLCGGEEILRTELQIISQRGEPPEGSEDWYKRRALLRVLKEW